MTDVESRDEQVEMSLRGLLTHLRSGGRLHLVWCQRLSGEWFCIQWLGFSRGEWRLYELSLTSQVWEVSSIRRDEALALIREVIAEHQAKLA